MQTVKLVLPRLHPAQAQVKHERKRFNVLNCGRRFGKTTLGIDLELEPMLEGYPVGWFSPTYKMLADVWRNVKYIYAPIVKNKLEQEHRLELVNGGVLDMWSLEDPDGARGRKYKRVVIDEAAKVKKLEEAWNEVIRATLADYEGDAYFKSTPKGLNYFYSLWNMADNDPLNWARWRFPTSANPFIRPSEIESMRLELPERVYRQEIEAEFLADGTYFQNIDKAAIIERQDEPEQHAGHYLVMGIDFALSNDYTVLTVGCRDCNRVVDWQRFNQIDFTYQRERIVDMAEHWNVGGILPERNSIGEPNIEILIQRELPILPGPDGKLGFNTTATTKPALIQGLATALEHDGFLVPRDYSDELRSYEVETMASGHPKFSAPTGQHDDRVISLALTWRALTQAATIDVIDDPFAGW
jgi:hypothetical protein